MSDDNYPGKGIPWGDFLYHRRRVIEEFVADGKSYAAIAVVLSMDAEQVEGIYTNGARDAASICSRVGLMKTILKPPSSDRPNQGTTGRRVRRS